MISNACSHRRLTIMRRYVGCLQKLFCSLYVLLRDLIYYILRGI